MRVCNELLSSESNEKENDFIAKNKVLQEYKMIDADENMLFKGKVAKEAGWFWSSQFVQNQSCCLLGKLGRLSSGHSTPLSSHRTTNVATPFSSKRVKRG